MLTETRSRSLLFLVLSATVVAATAAAGVIRPARADEPGAANLFRRENLVAWCIVPFDAKKRGPEERGAMLAKLGFKHFAYDYRAEHIPTFDAEIEALKKHKISLDAWWFPGALNDEAKGILEVCRKHNVTPQLWVTGGDGPTKSPEEQRQRVEQEAARLRPIAEAAAAQGMKVGLYNHGGWFGEPENQLAIIEHLKLANVGIVYNLHHGHDHVDRLPELLKKMRPHLLAFNLNGMTRNGDRVGRKILQLGQGELDLTLLRMLRDSGYDGPVGILGHTQDDAEARLQDNLDGLDWLLPQLEGQPSGPRPKPRTPVPMATAAAAPIPSGYIAAGKSEYRTPPLTVELRATLRTKAGYNILVASDTKASAAHWEIFSMAGSGMLTVYMPGMTPDHIRSEVAIADSRPHDIAMTYEANRVRLYVDGKPAADQVIDSKNGKAVPGDLAFGRLVEGGIGCDGTLEFVRISKGTRKIEPREKSTSAIPAPPLRKGGQGGAGGVAAAETDAKDTANKNPPATKSDARSTPADSNATPPAPPSEGGEPDKRRAPPLDDATLGLWIFDKPDANEVPDLSPLKNPAKRASASVSSTNNAYPPPGPQLTPVNPSLKAVLIDRSPADVYMGIKADSQGQLFVGGREAVFVFEPTPNGDYHRRELLHFPPDSIIMGLELRGNDLYILASNALYLVPDGRVKREGLEPQRILWGLPLDLHVSFHCMAWGPDGNLYLNHGDPLLQYGDWSRPDHWGHWTLYCGKDAKPVPFTGQGAVLRVKPDGTGLHVVATGLRGPVGLAFDPDGHLFTNDNDHESRADQYAPCKLLHVVDGIDFGWPRGWMASKSPERFDLIEPMSADLGRGVPCDLTWCDEPGLPESLRRKLLMCRWDRSAVTAYPLEKRGISFKTTESTIATGENNARPVGIAIGRGGRIFVTSLFQTGNQAAPDCVSEIVMLTPTDDLPQHSFESHDVTKATEAQLRADAAGASWERRSRAQQELLRRGVEKPVKWGGLAFADAPDFPKVAAAARSHDSYERQLAIHWLARHATREELKTLLQLTGSDSEGRLAGVLALGRRLTVPDVHSEPVKNIKLFYPKESAFFHAKQRFYGSRQDVDPSTLARVGSFTTAEWWAVTGGATEQQRWAGDLLNVVDGPGPAGMQAAYFLGILNDPAIQGPLADKIVAHRIHKLEANRKLALHTVKQAWIVGPFSDFQPGMPSHPPEKGMVDLSATYETAAGERGWEEAVPRGGVLLLQHEKAGSPSSVYASFQVQSATRQHALLKISARSATVLARHNGNSVWTRRARESVDREALLVDLEPGSNDFLIRSLSREGPYSMRIDVQAVDRIEIVLPSRLGGAELARRLSAASAAGGNQPVPAEFQTLDWPAQAMSGNVAEGRRLFGTLACGKCHAIAPDQKGNGAPSLAGAAKRFTVHFLVESILLPSRQIAEPFRGTTLVLKDGRVLTGLVTSESANELELLQPDATRRTVPAAEIDERSPSKISPMPQGLVKTPKELRDLLAYLQSENPLPP